MTPYQMQNDRFYRLGCAVVSLVVGIGGALVFGVMLAKAAIFIADHL